MSEYVQTNGIFMPAAGPDRGDLPWHWPHTAEIGERARALFDADPVGKLCVPFASQPAHVREKYLAMASVT